VRALARAVRYSLWRSTPPGTFPELRALDIDAARELVQKAGSEVAELFVYPGDQHLFTDSSLPSYDAGAAALVLQRSRDFLDRLK
jgi:dienelactone hydrolase